MRRAMDAIELPKAESTDKLEDLIARYKKTWAAGAVLASGTGIVRADSRAAERYGAVPPAQDAPRARLQVA